jgi:hypothetical protein
MQHYERLEKAAIALTLGLQKRVIAQGFMPLNDGDSGFLEVPLRNLLAHTTLTQVHAAPCRKVTSQCLT